VQSSDGAYQKCRFTVANTATPKQPSPDTFDYEIFRLSATVKEPGSSVQLQNALVAVKAGATAPIDVYVAPRNGAAPSIVVTLQAQSESDRSKTAVAECSVTTGT
jgi:hypothetical protein